MADDLLIIGYGNPGRLDDGLGPAFADAVEKLGFERTTTDAQYQLTVEDSARISDFDMVIFADAAVKGREPYSFAGVNPGYSMSFSTHSVEPDAVVSMANKLFDRYPKCYLLGIRGYEFDDFGESLSEGARENLTRTLIEFEKVIESRSFDGAVTD